MKNIPIIILTVMFGFSNLWAQELGDRVFPLWKEGEMEIHHINTGKGESVFCILPDGTTMVIDAGDAGERADPEIAQSLCANSGQPGECIARYISAHLPSLEKSKIDYFLLTHFHTDHMGSPNDRSSITKKGGAYYLSGITELAEYLPIGKLVDRDWPSYDYPVAQKGLSFDNYKKFLQWQQDNTGMKVERFKPGINSQFTLLNQPEQYPDFEVRNIVSNGEVWTGNGEGTVKLFPAGARVHENKVSAGIRISYGEFDYFNGGDINGRLPLNTEQWLDIETPVGEVLGPVEVCEANHHAWIDAMNEPFLFNVRPQVIVIQLWHTSHLNLSVLQSMANTKINPSLKHIIPTNVPEVSKVYLGEDQMKKVTGNGGHVVIKVEPGGDKYSVFLLNDTDDSFTVRSSYGPYECQ